MWRDPKLPIPGEVLLQRSYHGAVLYLLVTSERSGAGISALTLLVLLALVCPPPPLPALLLGSEATWVQATEELGRSTQAVRELESACLESSLDSTFHRLPGLGHIACLHFIIRKMEIMGFYGVLRSHKWITTGNALSTVSAAQAGQMPFCKYE